MSTQPDIDQVFFNTFENLLRHRRDDWVTQLQNLCQTFWSSLDVDTEVRSDGVLRFIQLLQQDDIFELARLVIPEFRSESNLQLTNSHKGEILRLTQNLRVNYARPRIGASVLSEQDGLFRMEKKLYAEVEVYRAGLILFGSETLNSTQRMDVQKRLTIGYKTVEKADEVVEQSMAVGRRGKGNGVGLSGGVGRATLVKGKRERKDQKRNPWPKKRKVGSID